MANETKGCNLTEEEIKQLIFHHGNMLGSFNSDIHSGIERINYLSKRLKAFQEPEEVKTEINRAAPGWGA